MLTYCHIRNRIYMCKSVLLHRQTMACQQFLPFMTSHSTQLSRQCEKKRTCKIYRSIETSLPHKRTHTKTQSCEKWKLLKGGIQKKTHKVKKRNVVDINYCCTGIVSTKGRKNFSFLRRKEMRVARHFDENSAFAAAAEKNVPRVKSGREGKKKFISNI